MEASTAAVASLSCPCWMDLREVEERRRRELQAIRGTLDGSCRGDLRLSSAVEDERKGDVASM